MSDEELIIYLRRSAVSYSHPFWKSADRIEALMEEQDKYRDAFNTNCLVLRGTEEHVERLEAEVERLRGALVTAREWVFGCTRAGINQDLAEADLATIDVALKGAAHE